MSEELIRAFLSHASEDKVFVENVALKLGRQYCLFDKFEFASGVEFKAAIDAALDRSGIFVLFVSKKSLRKFWVNYEMDEAQARAVRGALERILVYVIDADVSVDEVPDDFKRAKVEMLLTPSQVARDIVMHTEDLLRLRGGKYYVGRGGDNDAFGKLLLRRVAGRSPNIFFVAGLPGVGRREFLKRTARDSLSLRKSVEVRVAEGHSLADLLIQLTDAMGTYSSFDSFVAEAERIKELSRQQLVQEILKCFSSLTKASELPILVDEGGLLGNDGGLEEWVREVMGQVLGSPDVYCGIVSNRRPLEAEDAGLVFYRLSPISEDATKLLVSQYATSFELALSEEQVDEFGKYVAGYPPAANFAVQQAKEYGVELVILSKERLVEFRRKFFFDYIQRLNMDPDSAQASVLRVLSCFSPLPLTAIGECLQLASDDLVGAVTKLIDLSLITVDDGLYRVADPVSEAATKHFGLPGLDQAREVVNTLKAHLESQEAKVRRLDVSRALFKAARLAGDDKVAKAAVRLTSDLVGLVEELYHQRRYEDAVKAGVLAFDEAPRASNALSYLIRSLVQLERWEKADEYLAKYERLVTRRDYLFLKAFMAKRRGQLHDAIAFYEQAREAGKTGVSISRELSQCYSLVGDYKNARRHLEDALEKEPDNRFVVDLWVTIEAHLGNREEAEKALKRLQSVDDPMFYLFRKSRIKWLFGDADEALKAIREALSQEGRPSFQVLAQLALCEQVAGSQADAARIVDRLDRDFGSTRRDVRIGLRTRLLISQGDPGGALDLLETTRDKASRSYKALRRDALKALVDAAPDDSGTTPRLAEIERLERQLNGALLDFVELDA